MISAVISAIVGAILKKVLSLFGIDPQRKLGQLEVKTAVQDKEIADDKTAEAVADKVGNMSDAELAELQRNLDSRDK